MQLDFVAIQKAVDQALAEDIGQGDATTMACVPTDLQSAAEIRSRECAVIAGLVFAQTAFHRCSSALRVKCLVADGTPVDPDTPILQVHGPSRALLSAERVALNFLQRLSGVATLTRSYADRLQGTNTVLLDTRKTTPGWRLLEKAAVRAGGGQNHRLSLSDAALVKDNHIVAAGGVLKAFEKVRAALPGVSVEVEVDNLDQLREVLVGKPDLILLDNMSPELCANAVAIVNGAVKLEASGGITLDNAAAYAMSGVDYLAIGALTHSAKVLDIGLDLKMGN